MHELDKTLEAARKRLQENLDSFDSEVAEQLSTEGERADLWTETDVSVDDLRTVLSALEALSSTSAGVTEEQTPRACTCHPSDAPPVPCTERYALSECQQEAAVEAERICMATAMRQWEVSLKRPDLSERDRVSGALMAYQRQALALTLISPAPVSQKEADEAYEIGKRDGYSDAVQQIDLLTGGDGEYRYCTDRDPERHTPDPDAMIRRIAARFEAGAKP